MTTGKTLSQAEHTIRSFNAKIMSVNQVPRRKIWLQKIVLWAGQPASFLKERKLLALASAGGTIAAVVIPVFMTGEEARLRIGQGWIWVVGAVLAATTLTDLLADQFDKVTSDDSESVLEDLAASQVSDLNDFIEQCCQASQLSGRQQKNYLDNLRDFLVVAAAQTLGHGTRASYYKLQTDADGNRELVEPVHRLRPGRSDQSSRGFYEKDDATNTIWSLLERADTEPQVVEYPSAVNHIDWNKVKFRAYYSVPVKYKETCYGFLSVNTIHLGSISESQRLAILGMARAYALTLALASK